MDKINKILNDINSKIISTKKDLEAAKKEASDVIYSQYKTVESITLATNKVTLILKRVDALNNLKNTVTTLKNNNKLNTTNGFHLVNKIESLLKTL